MFSEIAKLTYLGSVIKKEGGAVVNAAELIRPLYKSTQFVNQEKYKLQQQYGLSRRMSKLFCCMRGTLGKSQRK